VSSRESRVTRVAGQLTDGSRGSRVKKCDQLSSLFSCSRLGPGAGVLGGVGEIPGTRNRALLAGALGGSDTSSPGRRFALTVAHLFDQV